MTAAVIAFGDKGYALGERITPLFETAVLTRCEKGGLSEWAAAHFDCDTLVFIGSCGIAVRAIAPYIKSKLSDPAVIVCDESGHFAISLLSGHVGGANALTERIAAAVGAVPVITTASDLYADERCKNLVLGIGCRRGIPVDVLRAVLDAVSRHSAQSCLRRFRFIPRPVRSERAYLAKRS